MILKKGISKEFFLLFILFCQLQKKYISWQFSCQMNILELLWETFTLQLFIMFSSRWSLVSKIIKMSFFDLHQSTLSGFKETETLRNNNEAMCSAAALPLSLGRIDYKVILKSEQKEVFIYCSGHICLDRCTLLALGPLISNQTVDCWCSL